MNVELKFFCFVLLVFSGFSHAQITYRDCPKAEDPCGTLDLHCLSKCAFQNETLAFKWSRKIMETDRAQSSIADIQSQKACLDAPAVEEAINSGLSKIPSSNAQKIPCSVTGNTWRYTYSQFEVNNLTPDQCNHVSAWLKSLAIRCQDWKKSALAGAAIAGIVIGSVVVVGGGIVFGVYWARFRQRG